MAMPEFNGFSSLLSAYDSKDIVYYFNSICNYLSESREGKKRPSKLSKPVCLLGSEMTQEQNGSVQIGKLVKRPNNSQD